MIPAVSPTANETVVLLSIACVLIGYAAHVVQTQSRWSPRPDRAEELVFVRYMGIVTGVAGLAILPLRAVLTPILTQASPSTAVAVFVVTTLIGAALWWVGYDTLVARGSTFRGTITRVHRLVT